VSRNTELMRQAHSHRRPSLRRRAPGTLTLELLQGCPSFQESHPRMPSMPAYTPRRAEKRRRLILLP
jgi:hypothetical protein